MHLRSFYRFSRAGEAIAVAMVLLLILLVVMYHASFSAQAGMEQPFPFSHRFHTTNKQLSCLVCHPGVIEHADAGMPSIETCMLCHQRIVITYPVIRRLRSYYQEGDFVGWERIAYVPDFVFFNHQMHIRHGFDCSHCHGDVKSMDRIVQVHEFTMGFCVDCHREEEASHDCFICHR